MTDLENACAELLSVQAQLKPLLEKADGLHERIAMLRSKDWIKANRVTREKVQLSEADGQFFGSVWRFGQWMKTTNCQKPFCEWNDRIYITADIMDGYMPETPATMDDLP